MLSFHRVARSLPVLLAAAAAFTLGCASDGSDPTATSAKPFGTSGANSPSTTVTVVVSIDSATLAPTHISHVRAYALNSRGDTLSGKTVVLSSTNPSVAEVSPGLVMAIGLGDAAIQAVVDGVTGFAPLAVLAREIGPLPATHLVVITQPTNTLNGQKFASAPAVQVRDDLDSLVKTSAATVTVTLASKTGTLLGTTTVNAVNGIARFTDLQVSGPGFYTLMFTSAPLLAAASNPFTLVADTTTTTSTLTQLFVNPVKTIVVAGSSQQFTASGVWSNGSTAVPVVNWTATGGTITSSGRFTAGASAGTFAVSATQQGGTATASIPVTVVLPQLTSVIIAPKSSTPQIGGTVQYSTTAAWNDAQSRPYTINYSATGGTITSTGVFTAGSTAGTFLIIATCTCGLADTAHASVQPAKLNQLVLSPATATLITNATRQFAVAGVWSDGSSNVPAVTYSATGGMVTAAGLYTAGSTPGTYRIIATQQGGTRADTSIINVGAATPSGSCARSVNVSTTTGLVTALSTAQAGDCITLAAGTYTLTSNLTITRGGTASAPVVLQGTGSSTIIDVNRQYLYLDASYFQLRRLRLTNFNLAGLWLRGVTGDVLDSVEIDHTLHEAMAIKNGSHHNVVRNSRFHDTGIAKAQYGEGIYIANSGDPGYPIDFGVTDNQVLNNHFGPNVRSDGVVVMEGADRTVIRGNYFDGTGSVYVPNQTQALLTVRASYVTVDSNYFKYGKPHAVQFLPATLGTMIGNVMTRNTIDLQNIQNYSGLFYGFFYTWRTLDTKVYCNNVMLSGALSNQPCTP